MTAHSLRRIFHRLGIITTSRFETHHNFRRARAEIARYPTNVQADLGLQSARTDPARIVIVYPLGHIAVL